MGSDKCVSVYLYKYAYATATDRTGDDWDVPPTSDVASDATVACVPTVHSTSCVDSDLRGLSSQDSVSGLTCGAVAGAGASPTRHTQHSHTSHTILRETISAYIIIKYCTHTHRTKPFGIQLTSSAARAQESCPDAPRPTPDTQGRAERCAGPPPRGARAPHREHSQTRARPRGLMVVCVQARVTQ